MWVLCGPSRVVNRLAAGDGGTSRSASLAELITRWHPAGNRQMPELAPTASCAGHGYPAPANPIGVS
jgi:hypothetical protein